MLFTRVISIRVINEKHVDLNDIDFAKIRLCARLNFEGCLMTANNVLMGFSAEIS